MEKLQLDLEEMRSKFIDSHKKISSAATGNAQLREEMEAITKLNHELQKDQANSDSEV